MSGFRQLHRIFLKCCLILNRIDAQVLALWQKTLLEAIMLLRDHPLLTYQSIRSWPPAWLYCRGFDNTHPRGEVGILKNVFVSSVHPSTRCYLIMEHAGGEYMGDLSISDVAFCVQIYAMLLRHCGKTIREIGDIDISDTRQVSDEYPHQPPPPHPAFLPAGRPRMKS
jgi:hypothetical protein